MHTRLENQIAKVTGSSSGNGRAIALALSAAGATIVCTDLQKQARKEGHEKDLGIDTDDVIRKQGAKACYVQADVRYGPQVENLVARLYRTLVGSTSWLTTQRNSQSKECRLPAMGGSAQQQSRRI
jgi:NAD(P)-dependent dehydrogenase (short-subunit alcohol dehydrogenase family)